MTHKNVDRRVMVRRHLHCFLLDLCSVVPYLWSVETTAARTADSTIAELVAPRSGVFVPGEASVAGVCLVVPSILVVL